jgi:cold-inducible RNA-binding protein
MQNVEEQAVTKKLYVGNLSYDTTEAGLSELFGAVGETLSVTLITDRGTGRSKGFAFVEMADDTLAQEAINQLDSQEVDGRPIKVAAARPKREDRGSGGGGGRRSRW